ncbi:dephospho-CoA kinase [Gammaproteobacteria bacterium]|jgi:dephospho-CoA kinase|nr:dephospho-CoA kinase [Gammaproteobacteria bacterium]MDA9997420.1 dephospho-CoA kinase [Gammaproteobacteria bacterium]MDC0367508.1 dephospho-CoA kinase [Gammaproteobacteria bacterium]MDC1123533.1 dephospho-CoA kinase [Gammaproteobacteria bacterium]MDC3247877.1 dephospho-CoA kinase [Gammaproteobacteria bacterium]
MIIGLTGGIGSGKSAAAHLFKAHGIDVIQADVIANKALDKGTQGYMNFVKIFGDEYLRKDLSINKSYLRQKIFANSSLKKTLENIIHPIVGQNISILIGLSKSPYQIIEVPLIYETGSQDNYDRILVVDCDESLQVKRASSRDSVNQASIKNILLNQASRHERLSIADDVIINNADIEQLEIEVNKLHEFYLNLLKD